MSEKRERTGSQQALWFSRWAALPWFSQCLLRRWSALSLDAGRAAAKAGAMPAKPANATMRTAPAQDAPRTGDAAVHRLRSAQHDSRCCRSSQRRRIVVSRGSWPGVSHNPDYTKSAPMEAWNRLCIGLYHRPAADCRRPQRRHLRRPRDVKRQVATTARLFLCRWCILCRIHRMCAT